MEAIVRYDYKAQERDELTLKKGELITKIRKKYGGWWEGTLEDGKQGLFPDNCVKVILESSGVSPTQVQRKQYRVKYNYIPVNVDELQLNVGDIVEMISEVEEGWWEGKLKNKIGVFPSNFVVEVDESELFPSVINLMSVDEQNEVELLEQKSSCSYVSVGIDVPVLPPKPNSVKEMCIVLFPYEAKHDDELTLKENDIIMLLSTDLPDKGWWKGQLNGKIGVFPDNFVKVISLGEDVCKRKRPSVTKTTTNKTRDNINKQATNSNVASLRKSLEIPVEQRGTKKPAISKKPSFSPSNSMEAMKISLSNSHQIEKLSSPDRSLNTSANSLSSETATMSKSFESDGKSWTETSVALQNTKLVSESVSEKSSSFIMKELDSVDGCGGSKVYRINSPGDRFPDNITNTKENFTEKEVDLNAVERSELLNHPTASRAKAPKRRPPSGINYKEEGILSEMNDKKYSYAITVNTNANLKSPAPWLEELKLNQVKKNYYEGNIRGGFTSSGSNVVFRYQRPASMFSGDSETHALTCQPKSLPLSSENISVIPSGVAPVVATSTAFPLSEKVVTINVSEWNLLLERINMMETRLEKRNEYFTKTIEKIKSSLASEVALRIEMKNEMDKLLDLVAQV